MRQGVTYVQVAFAGDEVRIVEAHIVPTFNDIRYGLVVNDVFVFCDFDGYVRYFRGVESEHNMVDALADVWFQVFLGKADKCVGYELFSGKSETANLGALNVGHRECLVWRFPCEVKPIGSGGAGERVGSYAFLCDGAAYGEGACCSRFPAVFVYGGDVVRIVIERWQLVLVCHLGSGGNDFAVAIYVEFQRPGSVGCFGYRFRSSLSEYYIDGLFGCLYRAYTKTCSVAHCDCLFGCCAGFAIGDIGFYKEVVVSGFSGYGGKVYPVEAVGKAYASTSRFQRACINNKCLCLGGDCAAIGNVEVFFAGDFDRGFQRG